MAEGKVIALRRAIESDDFPLEQIILVGIGHRRHLSTHYKLTVEFSDETFTRYVVWIAVVSDDLKDREGKRIDQRFRLNMLILTPPVLLNGLSSLYDLDLPLKSASSLRVAYVQAVRAYLRKRGALTIELNRDQGRLYFTLVLPEGTARGIQRFQTWSEWLIQK